VSQPANTQALPLLSRLRCVAQLLLLRSSGVAGLVAGTTLAAGVC
jgi:hypothetical protein